MIQRHTLSTCLFIANPYIANFVNVHVELSMHQHFKVMTCYRFFFISNYFFLRAVIKYCFHPKAWKQYGIPIFCWSSLGLDNTLCPCSLVLRSRAIPLPLSPRICNIIPISRLSLQTVFDGSLPCPWVYALVFCFCFVGFFNLRCTWNAHDFAVKRHISW